MDRKGGMAAAAVLIAILGISFVPRKGGESAAPSAPEKREAHLRQPRPVAHGKPEAGEACEEIVDRVKRFYKADNGVAEIGLPLSCYPNAVGDQTESHLQENTKLNFAIALAPDPAQTNLPLVFDRAIEAIQQAAQDEGYSYDSSWFPWTEEKTYDRFLDEELAETLRSQMQQQPGVLVFRGGGKDSYTGGLLVFVVGEQPTGGIDDEQFENAMQWIAKLKLDPATNGLHILGPTFSGSLPSLARELNDVPKNQVWVYSGTANSNQSVDQFKQFLCGSNDCRHFRTFLESDALTTHRFLEFLHNSGYCHLDRVAILSEDETAYGNQPPTGDSNPPTAGGAIAGKAAQEAGAASKTPAATKPAGIASQGGCNFVDPNDALETAPIHLYYPRDIATLRSAYSKQSIFSAGKAQNNAPSTTLRGDLGEAASKHDTVQTYAEDLTPAAQEAALFGIVNVLQAKRVQFVVIRSSNSLDQLFLSEFLRRAYPGGRVVLDGADLLFRRGLQGEVLRGVMMLSSYPLLSWSQDAVRPVQFQNGDYTVMGPNTVKSYRIFGADTAEGTYIAARGLFASGNKNEGPVGDYGPPMLSATGTTPDDLRPATWLTVVGHRQFWPVAVLNCYTLNQGAIDPGGGGTTALLLAAKAAGKPTGDKVAAAQFPPDTAALVMFCCALAAVHFLLCWKGCMIGAPRVRAYFAPIPLAQQPVLIFIGSLLLGALGLTFAGATGLMDGFYSGHQRWFLWLAVTWMAGCGWFGFLINYSLLRKEQPQAKAQGGAVKQELAFGAAASSGGGSSSIAGTAAEPVAPNAENGPPEPAPTGATLGRSRPDQTKVANAKTRLRTWFDSIGSAVGSRWRVLVQRLEHVRDRLAARQIRGSLLGKIWLLLLACLLLGRWYLNSRLTPATRLAAFWRNGHISNGVSGLLPQALLILGAYAWFWYNLRGLSLFGEDRPVLPSRDSLPESFHKPNEQPCFESQDDRHDSKLKRDDSGARLFAMFSAEQAGAGIEEAAHPLGWFYVRSLFCLLPIILICWLALGEQVVQTLGDRTFARLIFIVMCCAIIVILADTLHLARTWGRLRQLLVFLDRLRLRRTLAILKGLSWSSVLSMSSNVLEERYRLISRQFESARNLQIALAAWHPDNPVDQAHQATAIAALNQCENMGLEFAETYSAALSDPDFANVAKLKRDLAAFQQILAKTAGCVMTNIILPAWQRDGQSLILESEPKEKSSDEKGEKPESPVPLAPPAHARAAEEFFVLPYLGFIQNILGGMRTMVIGILLLFMATTLALSSYPFSPGPPLGAIFLVVFLIVGATVFFVYAEMHRDATLSHITQTRAGELGFEFWGKIVSFGIGPLIGLLTTLFPSLTDFVVSWLQPGTEMIK